MKNSQSKPDYSIVIPAYNEERYIKNTILSLKQQSYNGNVEIIVVDNNSTDKTVKIAKNAGVIVIEEPQIGVCFARQAGTEYAKGSIIISTDADTIFHKDWLNNIDICFKKHPKIVAIAGGCKYTDDPPWWGIAYPVVLFGTVNFIFKYTGYTLYASATNIAFKKSAWTGYNTSLTQGGDELDLLHRLRKKGKIFFAHKNDTLTSSRRLQKGLIYNLFVSAITYYFVEYYLSKIFGRPVIGAQPKIRGYPSPKQYIYAKIAKNKHKISTIKD